jgi:phage virion morphogenesis protein
MGALIEVKVNERDLAVAKEFLARLRARLSDLTPVMRAIGEDILAGAQRSFDEQQSPEGVAWKPSHRAQGDVKPPHGTPKTLLDNGILYGSIHVGEVTDKSVTVGTMDERAAVHQFGAAQGEFGIMSVLIREHTRRTKKGEQTVHEHTRWLQLPWGNIPARPYLGWNERIEADVIRTVTDYLMNPEGRA